MSDNIPSPKVEKCGACGRRYFADEEHRCSPFAESRDQRRQRRFDEIREAAKALGAKSVFVVNLNDYPLFVAKNGHEASEFQRANNEPDLGLFVHVSEVPCSVES